MSELEKVKKERDELLVLIRRALPLLPNIPTTAIADIRFEMQKAIDPFGDMEMMTRKIYYQNLHDDIKLHEESLEIMGPKDQLNPEQLAEFKVITQKLRDCKFLLMSADGVLQEIAGDDLYCSPIDLSDAEMLKKKIEDDEKLLNALGDDYLDDDKEQAIYNTLRSSIETCKRLLKDTEEKK